MQLSGKLFFLASILHLILPSVIWTEEIQIVPAEFSCANAILADSLFMSIGSVIRTEGPHNDAWLRARGPPMMLPRQSPLRPMRQ